MHTRREMAGPPYNMGWNPQMYYYPCMYICIYIYIYIVVSFVREHSLNFEGGEGVEVMFRILCLEKRINVWVSA